MFDHKPSQRSLVWPEKQIKTHNILNFPKTQKHGSFVKNRSNTKKEHEEQMKNTQREPNKVALKPNLIWIIQRHRHIGNHSRINNLVSNINDYHSMNTIWSKWGFAIWWFWFLGFLVVLLDLRGKELFSAFWYWEKGFKPLIRTLWEALKCEHVKIWVVFE